MRDIVTKVDTVPGAHRPGSIRTKTIYKNFEDFARSHRDASSEESETCSSTAKYKTLPPSFMEVDGYKSRHDDQESVGSDDSGVGSISETKDHHGNRYAAYNEFLSGYRKCPEGQQQKKVVRSEIYIQVGDAVDEGKAGAPGRHLQRAPSDGGSKTYLSKLQNFNSIPRRFEPGAYPKPEVAKSIVRPVVAPNLSSLKGQEEVLRVKPKLPPAPVQLKSNLRPQVKKTLSFEGPMQNTTTIVRVPPPPPPFVEVKQQTPAVVNASVSVKETANPMQMVFAEIRKRNPDQKQTSIVVAAKPEVCSIPPPPPKMPSVLQSNSEGIPPPPPPPIMPQANAATWRKTCAPQENRVPEQKSVQDREQHKEATVNSRPAPPLLQQELFKKLSERSKKNRNNEVVVESKSPECQNIGVKNDVPVQQKYNTLSRFMETERECLQQQQQQQCSTLERQDPKKKIVYNVYREMLGSYNAKANGIVSSMPARMVREDQGVKKQLESL